MTLTDQAQRLEEYAAQIRLAAEKLDRPLSASERERIAGDALCETASGARLIARIDDALRAIARNAAEPDGPKIVRGDFKPGLRAVPDPFSLHDHNPPPAA